MKKKSFMYLSVLLIMMNACRLFSDENSDKLYNFFQSIKAPRTGLYRSFTYSAHYFDDTRFNPRIYMATTDGYLDNQAFIYDDALVLIALSELGKYDEAAVLLRVLEDNFSIRRNGRTGLFNSYLIYSFDNFFMGASGKRNLLSMGIDGDRIHVGPNAFIGLACQHHYYRSKSPEFLRFIIKIFLWIKSVRHFQMPDNTAGAPSMGYGWGPRWQEIFSTENILDVYAFCRNLIQIYEESPKGMIDLFKKYKVSLDDIKNEYNSVGRWLKEVAYNRKKGVFSIGAWQRGSEFKLDEYEALDVNSWAVQAILPEGLDQMNINPVKLMKHTEDRFLVKVRINGQDFHGFDFTNKFGFIRNRDFKTIWWEGTGEMIVTYQMLADYCGKKGIKKQATIFRIKADYFINEMNRFIKHLKLENNALPYISHRLGERDSAWSFNDWWPMARSEEGRFAVCISSTVWRYFGITRFNPFDINSVPASSTP